MNGPFLSTAIQQNSNRHGAPATLVNHMTGIPAASLGTLQHPIPVLTALAGRERVPMDHPSHIIDRYKAAAHSSPSGDIRDVTRSCSTDTAPDSSQPCKASVEFHVV